MSEVPQPFRAFGDRGLGIGQFAAKVGERAVGLDERVTGKVAPAVIPGNKQLGTVGLDGHRVLPIRCDGDAVGACDEQDAGGGDSERPSE